MKSRLLSALAVLLLAPGLHAARNAMEVVLGDDAQDTDCSYVKATPSWTSSPSFSPSPTPTITETPTPDKVVAAIQDLGFAAEWETQNTLKVTLSDVSARFDNSKADLKPEALERLKKLSQLLGKEPFNNGSLQVDGHTDAPGRASFNLRLSQKRAETVRDVMVQMGVPIGSFVSVSGWAATKPLIVSSDPEQDAQNRRVEVRVHLGADFQAPPTATPSLTPTASETPTPAETATETFSPTPASVETATVTATPAPEAPAESPTPSPEATVLPSVEPTPEPSPEQSPAPTPEPSPKA